MKWNEVLEVMSDDVRRFANGELSGDGLYELAIAKGIGPLVRPVVRNGVQRSRKSAREALRRRGLLN